MSKSFSITNRKGQSFEVIVDDDMFDSVMKHKWHIAVCAGRPYVSRTVDKKPYRLHWDIVGLPPKGMHTDHINGNPLDNRRGNLRLCSLEENVRNVGAYRTNTSGYKGVSRHKTTGRWIAQSSVGGKKHYIGLFDTIQDAYSAYCNFVRVHHGEFANFG